MKFDEIISLKEGKEKQKKLEKWYKEDVNVSSWMDKPYKNSIIRFHDRIEYKKNGKYHRLNGPAIEYFGNKNQTTEDKYYYNGEYYEDKDEWLAVTKKVLRKLKLKKIKKLD